MDDEDSKKREDDSDLEGEDKMYHSDFEISPTRRRIQTLQSTEDEKESESEKAESGNSNVL